MTARSSSIVLNKRKNVEDVDVIEIGDSSEDEASHARPAKILKSQISTALGHHSAQDLDVFQAHNLNLTSSQLSSSQRNKALLLLGFNFNSNGDESLKLSQPGASQVDQQREVKECSSESWNKHKAPVLDSERRQEDNDPWYVKHEPKTLEEVSIALQPKKATELINWLESQQPHSYRAGSSRLLILSGPPGSCKSTAVKVLSSQQGFDMVEWTPPAPMLWSEFRQQAPGNDKDRGTEYISKLDEFDMFVSRAKYPSLPVLKSTKYLEETGEGVPLAHGNNRSEKSKLILIDDLPHVMDAAGSLRLLSSLQDLVATSRCPVILLTTSTSTSSSSTIGEGGSNAVLGSAKGLHKDMLAGLLARGAVNISFNPVTNANISKVVANVAKKEGLSIPEAAVASIVSLCNGDVRNAIQSLQLMYQSQSSQIRALPTSSEKAKPLSKRAGAAAAKANASRVLLPSELQGFAQLQRDQGLQLFHVLGKILYNKRDSSLLEAGHEDTGLFFDGAGGEGGNRGSGAQGGFRKLGRGSASRALEEATALIQKQQQLSQRPMPWMADLERMASSVILPARCCRPPMRYKPEELLLQSNLDAAGAASFLHENYLSFISEDAVEDAALAAKYMSDAGFLAGYRGGLAGSFLGFSGLEEAPEGSVLHACAASVASRGLLFANQRPAPRKFLSMRAPAYHAVSMACDANRACLQESCLHMAQQQGTMVAGGSSLVIAAEVLPRMRLMAQSPGYSWLHSFLPSRWSHLRDGSIVVIGSSDVSGNGRQTLRGSVVLAGSCVASMVKGLSLSISKGDQATDSRGSATMFEDSDPIED
ncbi:hypothetical protein CEUSTIGMA_g7341.t1 [Chlamydomonas eustigma]|uniref:AAA+ ATPase domain-containing protein n=1 Tax=Chlamydomonas eustigma TaxID=1157962 RepID=A0A250X9Y2_9CHLO|nr:hypothetical protein CEUSTIGMA_g7341.t1 [Chlamydomonas eustigma]|eukprot:GAX79901.1 hypothetical protein CEUSTIGMA_g7341.t1 [Chlamydomonas eustigma]